MDAEAKPTKHASSADLPRVAPDTSFRFERPSAAQGRIDNDQRTSSFRAGDGRRQMRPAHEGLTSGKRAIDHAERLRLAAKPRGVARRFLADPPDAAEHDEDALEHKDDE